MTQPVLPQPSDPDEQAKPCYLETLAPELLDLIFFETESLRTLANFITTTSFVYRHFDQRKCYILWCVLQNELGPVLVDARFLHRFPYTAPGFPGMWDVDFDRLHDDATLYRHMLADSESPWHAVPSLAKITQLCHTFYDINFLTSTYIDVQLRSFDAEGGAATAPPSRTEWLRVLRAFYRYQIVSNAWAPSNRNLSLVERDVAAISNTSDHQGTRLGLFAAFEPWELQQVDHAAWFIRTLCQSLCLTEAEQPEPHIIDKDEYGKMLSHADHLVRYMREHPNLTGPTLRNLPSQAFETTELLLRTTAPAYDLFVRQCALLPLGFAWQSICSETFPDPAREKREADSSSEGGEGGASLVFVGDALNMPPFGWVDALGGRYVNCFGEALGTRPRRVSDDVESREFYHNKLFIWMRAGFTMWDRKRVDAMKDLPMLEQLQTDWAV